MTFAERYETILVPVIFRPWAQELIARAGLSGGERVLDLGCGTGVVTREVARTRTKPASLTALDHSAGMLAQARANAQAEGVAAQWIEGDAGDLPFDDASFDVAFCQQALQFFPDKPRAVSELHRVLAPGARAVVCVQTAIGENPHLLAQAKSMERNIGPEAGAAVRAICGFPEPTALATMFEEAGFDQVAVERVELWLHHPDARAFARGAMGGMHTGDRITALDSEKQNRAVADFMACLDRYLDGDSIRFPHVSNVVTAVR